LVYIHCLGAYLLLSYENRILRRLQASGFGWLPKLVGFPFLVYEWMPGDSLGWTADTSSSRDTRQHFLDQLAEIQLGLILCTRVDGMYLVSKHRSRELSYTDPLQESLVNHVTRVIDHRISRICRGELPSLRVRDCFYHRYLITQIFAKVNWCGPRFIGHNDFSPQYILVENDVNISGILDWSFAAEEPFQLAAAMPWLLRPRCG
jgi:hypothetical protein